MEMQKQAVKTTVVICLVCALIALMTPVIAADDGLACRFTGTVMAGGAETPLGTRITAVIDGDEFHTHTPVAADSSTYALTIVPPQGTSYPNGAEVIFKINGYEAEQRSVYVAGAHFGLDLTTTTAQPLSYGTVQSATSPGSSPVGDKTFNWGLVIGLSILAFAVVSLTYYVILLRRIGRKHVLGIHADL